MKRGGDSNFFCWLNNSECLFIERFKHLGNASFFLLHVGVNIKVERCGDVRMTQEHAHGFIVAILRSSKSGYVRKKNQDICIFQIINGIRANKGSKGYEL